MTNPRQKISPSLISSVLSFIQPFGTKKLTEEITLILKGCCDPVITLSDIACDSTEGIPGIIMTLSITDPILGGKIVNVFVTTLDYPDFAGFGTVTLDKNGVGELTIQTPYFNSSGGTTDYLFTLIPQGLNVTHTTTVNGSFPNCD